MSKALIASIIQESAALSAAEANRVADDLFDAIIKELKKSGKFTLPSFGTFTVPKTKADKRLNPRTGEAFKLKAGKTVRFKASPALKVTASASNATHLSTPPHEETNVPGSSEPGEHSSIGAAVAKRFSVATQRAIQQAHARDLAVPVRRDGVAMELRPDGRTAPIDDFGHWQPSGWASKRTS